MLLTLESASGIAVVGSEAMGDISVTGSSWYGLFFCIELHARSLVISC